MSSHRKGVKDHEQLSSRSRLRDISHEIRKGKREQLAKRFRSIGDDESATNFHFPGDVESLIAEIKAAPVPHILLAKLKSLRVRLCLADPPIQAVISSGLINVLVDSLLSCDDSLKLEIIWCLTNIASGDHEETREVLRAVPALLHVLGGGGDVSVKEQSCWTIGNIAGDSDEYRDILLKNGALKPLSDFLVSSLSVTDASGGYLSGAQTAAWALSNLTRGSTPGQVFLDSGTAQQLLSLLSYPDINVATEIVWSFAFLTAKEEPVVDILVNLGIARAILNFALRCDPKSINCIPAVRCLGNLSSGPVRWLAGVFLDDVSLQELLTVLARFTDVSVSGAHRAVAKEAFWVLTNVLGADESHRARILQSALYPQSQQNIAGALLSDRFELQKEALFALQNILLDGVDCAGSIIYSEGMFPQLVQLLRAPDSDVALAAVRVTRTVAKASAQSLERFTELNLYEALDDLQYGTTLPEVQHAAKSLADELFESDADADAELPLSASGTVASLGSGSSSVQTDSTPVAAGRGMGRGSQVNRPAWMTS